MTSITFFNHKGGVGKTTLILNTGLALARNGTRILFIDADPQANLTSGLLSESQYQDSVEQELDIYHALLPVINGQGDVKDIKPIEVRDNAFLLPGHFLLSEFEEMLPTAWTQFLAGQPIGYQMSTAIDRLIDRCTSIVSAEYVLIDVGPNAGALNRVILTSSDGFVVPIAPDLFSLTALASVGKSIYRWVEEWKIGSDAILRKSIQGSPEVRDANPIPLGYVVHQFSTWRKQPAHAFRKWLDAVPQKFKEGIIDKLEPLGISVPETEMEITSVKNYGALIPSAQKFNKAIFELDDEVVGSHKQSAKDTLTTFAALGDELMRRSSTYLD